MKITTSILMLMLCTAAGAEEQTWYCQEVGKTGMQWEAETETWNKADFRHREYRIEQIGDRLVFPEGMAFFEATCKRDSVSEHVITCGDHFNSFLINTKTGNATYSNALGWVYCDPTLMPETLAVSALECEVR